MDKYYKQLRPAPLLSVIIPVYNAAEYLPTALESVLSQTYSRLQVICVDDGSSDASAEILRHFSGADSRVLVLSQENRGVSAARNAAMERAQGEYILFLDSDDWLDADTCSKALDIAFEHDADVVMWGYRKEYAEGSEVVQPIEGYTVYEGEELQRLHCRLIGPTDAELKHPEQLDSLGVVWGKLYRSRVLKGRGVGFVDLQEIGSAEDSLLNICAFSAVKKAVYTPDILHHYRKEGAHMTSKWRERLEEQWGRLFMRMEAAVSSLPYRERAEQALINRKALSVIGLGLNALRAPVGKSTIYRTMGKLLRASWYREAVAGLPLRYFPPHWKLFFACCKYRCTPGVFALLLAIDRILKGRA